MTAPALLHFGPWAKYAKDDVFEICGALASAEAVLRRLGQWEEACRVAEVFDLVEAGLTTSSARSRPRVS